MRKCILCGEFWVITDEGLRPGCACGKRKEPEKKRKAPKIEEKEDEGLEDDIEEGDKDDRDYKVEEEDQPDSETRDNSDPLGGGDDSEDTLISEDDIGVEREMMRPAYSKKKFKSKKPVDLSKKSERKIHNMNPNMLRGMLNSPKTPRKMKEAWLAKLTAAEKRTLGVSHMVEESEEETPIKFPNIEYDEEEHINDDNNDNNENGNNDYNDNDNNDKNPIYGEDKMEQEIETPTAMPMGKEMFLNDVIIEADKQLSYLSKKAESDPSYALAKSVLERHKAYLLKVRETRFDMMNKPEMRSAFPQQSVAFQQSTAQQQTKPLPSIFQEYHNAQAQYQQPQFQQIQQYPQEGGWIATGSQGTPYNRPMPQPAKPFWKDMFQGRNLIIMVAIAAAIYYWYNGGL